MEPPHREFDELTEDLGIEELVRRGEIPLRGRTRSGELYDFTVAPGIGPGARRWMFGAFGVVVAGAVLWVVFR
jgi:hypothetical protein